MLRASIFRAFEPEGRQPVAHGVSRGCSGGAESPRMGRKRRSFFRPVPGLIVSARLPTAYAVAIVLRPYGAGNDASLVSTVMLLLALPQIWKRRKLVSTFMPHTPGADGNGVAVRSP
jgi:hypothetical protein